MSEKITHAELEIGQIITCPNCRRSNRLYQQISQVTYSCGNCQNPLPNPFSSAATETQSTGGKALGLAILAGILIAGAGLVSFSTHILSGSQSSSASSSPIPSSAPSSVPSSTPLSSTLPSTFASPLASVQPSVSLQNRSLPASTVLVSPATSGNGSLKVANGTSRDTYIKLVDPVSRKSTAAFYIKASSTFTLKQIPDGTYQVLFMSGEDWDAQARSFTRSKSLKKFEKSLDFTTQQLTDKIRYTAFELTLNPVVGGNARTSEVDEQEFAQY